MLDTDIKLVYQRPAGFTDITTHYCPGCTHGVAHRLIAEVLEEMGELGHTIGVAPVGCSVFAYNYFDFDFVEAPHGRAPAMATGIKRTLPDKIVFTYQGDGDLASIGMGEIVAAAARGEQITTIFINNTNYGMTGGQMAPTTLPGQKTTSSPLGRDVERQGYPIRTAELLSSLEGAAYVARRCQSGRGAYADICRGTAHAFRPDLPRRGRGPAARVPLRRAPGAHASPESGHG